MIRTTNTLPLAVALLLALAGCSHAGQGELPKAAPTASQQNSQAAAAHAPSPQASAQPSPSAARPARSPEAFVRELYREHDAERSPFFQTEDRARVDKYFEKALADLIWKDAVGSQGEVGALGADPLYNAQDTEIKNFAVQKAKIDGMKATVPVTFVNFEDKVKITFALAQEDGAWKIADIRYQEGHALLKLFKEAAAEN